MAKPGRGAYPILFLTVVVLVSVVALTLIDGITSERILEAQADEVKQMLGSLFPSLDSYELSNDTGRYAVLEDGSRIGIAFMTQAIGYGGPIDILVGLGPDHTLRGIRIISQQETPGLGARIVETGFLDQYVGLAVDDLALRKDGGSVDAITGATISSTAVTDRLREAILEMIEEGGDGP